MCVAHLMALKWNEISSKIEFFSVASVCIPSVFMQFLHLEYSWSCTCTVSLFIACLSLWTCSSLIRLLINVNMISLLCLVVEDELDILWCIGIQDFNSNQAWTEKPVQKCVTACFNNKWVFVMGLVWLILIHVDLRKLIYLFFLHAIKAWYVGIPVMKHLCSLL